MLDLAQNGFGIIRDRSVAQVQIGDRNNVAENGIGEISMRSALLSEGCVVLRFVSYFIFHFGGNAWGILQWLLVRRSCRVGRLLKAGGPERIPKAFDG